MIIIIIGVLTGSDARKVTRVADEYQSHTKY